MGRVAAGIMQMRRQADGLSGRLKTASAREARNKKRGHSRRQEFDSIGSRMYRQAPGRCDVLQVDQPESAAPTSGGSEISCSTALSSLKRDHLWRHPGSCMPHLGCTHFRPIEPTRQLLQAVRQHDRPASARPRRVMECLNDRPRCRPNK